MIKTQQEIGRLEMAKKREVILDYITKKDSTREELKKWIDTNDFIIDFVLEDLARRKQIYLERGLFRRIKNGN